MTTINNYDSDDHPEREDYEDLREAVQQSVLYSRQKTVNKILSSVLIELLNCGFTLRDCFEAISAYLHPKYPQASRLAEETAAVLEEVEETEE